jgi:hypothetical protein
MRNILLFILLTFSVSAFATKTPLLYCHDNSNYKVIVDIDMDRITFDGEEHPIESYTTKLSYQTNSYVNTRGLLVYQEIKQKNNLSLIVYTFNAVTQELIGSHSFYCEAK